MIYGSSFFLDDKIASGNIRPLRVTRITTLTWKMYFISFFILFIRGRQKTSVILDRISTVFSKQNKICFLRIVVKTFLLSFFVFGHSTFFSDKGITCNIGNVRKEELAKTFGYFIPFTCKV